MNLFSFNAIKGKSREVVTIMRKLPRVILALIFFSSMGGGFLDICPGSSLASTQEDLPSPQEDKVVGPRCPPGMCLIPQGFLLSKRDKAFGMYFTDEKNGWVVGDNGLALRTDNGGSYWYRVQISDESTFNDVCFVGEKGWIVGAVGIIFSTEDGGKTWKKQDSNIQKSLMKVLFLDKDRGFTIGVDGTILKTVNGGMSWENVSIDCMAILPPEMMEVGIVSLNLYDIFFVDETSGWIVGDSGAIFHSKDGGKEWSLVNIGTLPPLFSISFMNARKGWAVGQNGFSLKTEDGGKSWNKVVIAKEKSLYRIRTHQDYGVIVGDEATLFKTNDGGETWAKVDLGLKPPYPWIADAWILPSNSAKILSIGKGIILVTGIVSKK